MTCLTGVLYRPAAEAELCSPRVLLLSRHIAAAVRGDEELARLYGSALDAGAAAAPPPAPQPAPDAAAFAAALPALPPAGGSDDEEGGEADVRRRLLRVVASLKPSGPFATAASFDLRALCGSPLGTFAIGTLAHAASVDFVPPLLRAEGMAEPVAFPLPEAHAQALRSLGEPASDGCGVWVRAERLELGAIKEWEESLRPAVRKALRALGVDKTTEVSSVLRGLRLCSAGSAPPSSSAATDLREGVFAQLEVALPSVRSGGALVVRSRRHQCLLEEAEPAVAARCSRVEAEFSRSGEATDQLLSHNQLGLLGLLRMLRERATSTRPRPPIELDLRPTNGRHGAPPSVAVFGVRAARALGHRLGGVAARRQQRRQQHRAAKQRQRRRASLQARLLSPPRRRRRRGDESGFAEG